LASSRASAAVSGNWNGASRAGPVSFKVSMSISARLYCRPMRGMHAPIAARNVVTRERGSYRSFTASNSPPVAGRSRPHVSHWLMFAATNARTASCFVG
jgi:hypothetical protein